MSNHAPCQNRQKTKITHFYLLFNLLFRKFSKIFVQVFFSLCYEKALKSCIFAPMLSHGAAAGISVSPYRFTHRCAILNTKPSRAEGSRTGGTVLCKKGI
ncbi:MAG: hypothetical protein ACLTWR_10095 [Agathobaculum desmolans]